MDKRESKDKVLTSKYNIDNINISSLSRRLWKIYLPIGFIGLLVAGTMWYGLSTGTHIEKQYLPLVDAATEIKFETTLAHLWLEKIISGDENEDIYEVWIHLDQAEWYTMAMLDGGQNGINTYIPPSDLKLRQDILEVLEKLRAFRNIAKERYANIEQASTGSDLDQHFDNVFNSFLKQADEVKTTLQKVINRDIKRFRTIQTILIVLSLILTGIVGLILNRYEQKQATNLSMLKATNQQLVASEQQLKASNQQLSAGEQQLRATNQQLIASEQQLKASNQQLSAGEQQLRATNQQLIASEQQLKASNQQLHQSLQKLALHVEQTPLGVIQWDLDWKVTEWNKAAEKIFGFTSEEAIGRHAAGLIVPESVREIVDQVWTDLIAQRGGNRSTNENNTKNNEIITCEWYNTPLIDDNGETIGVASLVLDITERKKAEEALQESEEQFKGLVEQSPLSIQVFTPEGKTTQVNKAFERLWGISIEDMKNYNILEDQQLEKLGIMPYIKRGFNGEQVSIPEAQYDSTETLDVGLRRWVKANIYPVRGKDGTILNIVLIHENITKRKIAEEALNKSENKYRTLFEKSADAVLIIEGDRFVDCNPATVKMLGYTNINEILELHPSLLSPELQPDGESSFEKANEMMSIAYTQGSHRFEWYHKRQNGEVFPVEVLLTNIPYGEKNVLHVVWRDITDRKKAEQNSEDLANILEKSLNEIYIFDAKTFNFIQVNYGARENIGYTHEELKKLTPLDIKPNFTKESFLELIKPLRDKTKEIITFETIHQRKDGSHYDVEVHLQLTDFLDRPVYVAIILDITETNRLQKLESRAERLEMAGTIAGQVAHDFNNLLGPIMAYPELIKDDLSHDHKARAYLNDIENAARKIANINQDLLTMGRRGHYNQDVLNLNQIVLQSTQELELRSKTVICETDLCENLMNIKGGAAQIHRLLTNLIVNAQDAMQNIGKISIKTENYYANNTSISFSRVPKGEYVKLTITDTGCGIPDDIIQKILDPFFSTKTTDKERGSGLGLSVVDAVIKDHNGYLDLSSIVGQGTSFYIYFPITREGITDKDINHSLRGSEKILIVDDDEIQREVAAALLNKLGYKVNTVDCGEKAILFIKDNPQDLVILDMVMPGGIDGTETYQQILKINPTQKAIILSGFSETDRVLEVQKLGAGAFVKKPVTKNIIATAVRTELDRPIEASKI